MWRTAPPSAPGAANTPTATTAKLLSTARVRLAARRWDDARRIAEQILQREPDDPAALLIAGEAATRLEQFSDALKYYAGVSPAHPEQYLLAIRTAAEIHRVHGSLDEAEKLFRTALQLTPDDPPTLTHLATLLMLTARPGAARPVLLRLLEIGAAGPQQLQWLADSERPAKAAGYLERSLEISPDQVFPRLGLANLLRLRGETAAAEALLSALRQRMPQQPEIEGTYARCLLEQERFSDLATWWSELSDHARNGADNWSIAGVVCESRQQPREACRCYLECLQRNPDHREASHRAGRLLLGLEQAELAQSLLQRAETLAEIARLAGTIEPSAPQPEVCQSLSGLLEELGRNWEALAWADQAARRGADPEWIRSTAGRLSSKVRQESGNVRESLPGLGQFKFDFPLPDFTPTVPVDVPIATASPQKLSFVDEAAAVGIDFTYFEDPDPATEGRRMREFTGGGVAAFDYDGDGWVDLYFTQGAELTPGRPPTTVYRDQLYRNLGGERFENVTARTGVVEDRFSGGVAAGDFNNDGFPDLYVANIGPNRLFENRGDGTFAEVTAPALPDSDQWTTSCAIADLNLDGIPDLFDVNYLEGNGLHELICQTSAGPRVCMPLAFAAAKDRLCLGVGDGTFRDLTEAAGLGLPDGNGLGLLIGPLTDASRADVFVANDMTANFLLRPRERTGAPRYEDVAASAGVAFSHEGKSQACMGVAAADFDGNGRLDLFVTNYFNEPNALYLAQSGGLFEDQCPRAGLRQPSLPMLGFGTQAIDVDLDGWPDLVVANGDLDDFSHESREFRMRPQLFRNRGAARFAEWLTAPAGDYFAANSVHRGRGLATLDWNRDGRQDFVVSHLDEPSALVTNRSESTGSFINIQLVGTVSSRDGIGAQVQMTHEQTGRAQTVWLTGGDGYQASNSRTLHVGLGKEAGLITLEVRWPAGGTTNVRGVERDTFVRLVESGRQDGAPVALP